MTQEKIRLGIWALGRSLPINAVYLALRKQSPSVAYASEREFAGLAGALQFPGRRRRGVVLTLDQTDRLTVEGLTLDVLPRGNGSMKDESGRNGRPLYRKPTGGVSDT